MRALVLSASLPVWLAGVATFAAPVPVSTGPAIDSHPSVVQRASGGFLVAFTRTTVRNNQVIDRDVLATASSDGVTWSPAVPVLAGRGVLEGPAEVLELRDGTLLLFATVQSGGVDRIRLASSVDGVSWTLGGLPIELGWGSTANQRNAHPAIRPDDSVLLVYEVPDTGGIYISLSTNRGILWDQSRHVVTTAGRSPKILHTKLGPLLVAYEGVAPPSTTWATLSPGGPAWADWPNPPVPCFNEGLENRMPVLVQYWDGSLVAYASLLTDGGSQGRDILRRFSSIGSQWIAAPEVVAAGPLDQGNPHPVIPGPGQVCVAWDETSETGGLPVSGDIYFECASDPRCTVPPDFPGTSDASDADPCEYSGTVLAWQPAASWGSGTGGTYSIYRSEDPFFLPDRTNLLVEGVSDTFYLDPTASPDLATCYVVRSVNNEVCGSSGTGLADSNTIRGCSKDTRMAPPGGPVADLRLKWDGRIRFSWTRAKGTDSTELRRASVAGPVSDWTVVSGSIPGPTFELDDPGAGCRFYTVRGVNSCGVPGP